MAEGQQRQQWEHTAAVMAVLANCSRDPKQTPKPFTPDDFNPYATPSDADDVTMIPLSMLKAAFT